MPLQELLTLLHICIYKAVYEFVASETAVSPRSSLLGTFREEERLRLSDRNSIYIRMT